MTNGGWVKLHRKLLDHPRASDPEWFSVWGHLMLLATHQDYKVLFKGVERVLKPGQLITSRDSLAKRCGISASKAERVLKWMEIEQQIEQEASAVNRLITITNWNTYQPAEQVVEHRPDTDRTPTGHRPDTNKNIKKEKNVEKIVVEANGSLQPQDQLWMDKLVADAAYFGIDIWREFRKCLQWCTVNRKHVTRRRFVNWLNKADKPLAKFPSEQKDWFRDVKNGKTMTGIEELR